jgi:hypothetical protein
MQQWGDASATLYFAVGNDPAVTTPCSSGSLDISSVMVMHHTDIDTSFCR